MALQYFKVIFYIEDEDGAAITSGNSPIAFKDTDESLAWITGTHVNNGLWEFNLPSGYTGFVVGVETSNGVYTKDSYLSGTVSGNNLGAMLAPVTQIEV